MEDHYYNPKNTSLISGLKPIRFSEKIILENLKLVHKYKELIKLFSTNSKVGKVNKFSMNNQK